MARKTIETKFLLFHPNWTELYNSGVSTQKIALKYNCSRKTVARFLKKKGILKEGICARIKNTTETFLSQIEKKECWEWTGPLNNKGYGQIRINNVSWLTHRYSYTYFKGEIPNGLFVCHKCDNPKCLNPDHLFLGTSKDNIVDMFLKHRNPKAKLTSEKVLEIRMARLSGVSVKELSSKYGIGESGIRKITSRRTWKYI